MQYVKYLEETRGNNNNNNNNDKGQLYAVQGKKLTFESKLPRSLTHPNNLNNFSIEPKWQWRVYEATDDMKYGVYIARRNAPTGRQITWRRMYPDSFVIEVDVNSHVMMAMSQHWRMKNNLSKWKIIHSIRVYVMDHFSNTRDSWIVSFVTNGSFSDETRFRSTISRNRTIISPLKCDNIKWFWEN